MDSGYERLVAMIFTLAVRDYKRVRHKTTPVSESIRKEIKKFFLSEKYNVTGLSGRELFSVLTGEEVV